MLSVMIAYEAGHEKEVTLVKENCPQCCERLSCNDGIIVCHGCGYTLMPDDSENRQCVAPLIEGELPELEVVRVPVLSQGTEVYV